MLRKLAAIGVLLLVLAPSAYLAWRLRAMPHLGYYHDDGIYWVSAQSLASGHGYRIASLPGEPYQTKYPPLYPALLAVIWKLNPHFPSNLPWASLFAWLLLPPYVLMVGALVRQYGFTQKEQAVLVLAAGLSPMAAVFSVSLMPELLFMTLFLASVVLAERASEEGAARWLPLLAGICGALAYLTKSAAAPLLFTAPLCFALRKQFVKAGLFFGAMLPAVAAWQWWSSAHVLRSWDLVSLYYTNYVGYQKYNVPWSDLPLVVWHNLDGILRGAGTLLTFDVPFGSKHLERVATVAAIAGCVRLARRTRKLQYPLAALGVSALLLIWHYTPEQRLVFPLYPLLLMGLWTELGNVAKALRASWRKPARPDRVAARVGAGVLAAFGLFLVFTTGFGLFFFLPDLFASYRSDLEARQPAYRWIQQNVPEQANVYAYDDPLMYLYTSRKSCALPIPTKLLFHDDQAGIHRLLVSIPDFAREHRLGYLLLTRGDFYRDLHEQGATQFWDTVEASRVFVPRFQTPTVRVYQFRDAGAARASLRSGL
ncbi:MAG TPA: hypothetical protein VMB25_07555 [Bryobacteraceae bacterium]|nr:hypothetical protein [Bryobacteraceae bacterium]